MISRRKFILTSAAATGMLATFPGDVFAAPPLTVKDVIDIVMKDFPGGVAADSVDTIKFGSEEMVVTGIVCTMFATMDVIAQAKKIGANFIIAHEPTFYNHADKRDYVPSNETLMKKLAGLREADVTVWRFHDYCHQLKPEPMSYGLAKKAGWASLYKPGQRVIVVPPMKLSKLVDQLKKTLNIKTVRVIGDLDMMCSKLALIPGAAGGQVHLRTVEETAPDVLIVGEVHEWETGEYTRDGNLQGKKSALIVLGHSQSEEPGMEVITEWLAPKVPGMKVTHIASGDPFVFR